MLTYEQAKKIVLKERGNMFDYVYSASDFGDFYGFVLAPFYINKDEPYYTGTCVIAVDKDTGSVSDYDMLSDMEMFDNAIRVE